jgi:hypothetical protein
MPSPAEGHDHEGGLDGPAGVPVTLFIKNRPARSGRDQIGALEARAGGDRHHGAAKSLAHPTDARLCHRERKAMCGCARATGACQAGGDHGRMLHPRPQSSGGRGANSNSCVPRLGRVIRDIRCKIAGNPRLTERFADLLALAARVRFAAREIAPSRVRGPPSPPERRLH